MLKGEDALMPPYDSDDMRRNENKAQKKVFEKQNVDEDKKKYGDPKKEAPKKD